MKALWPLWVGLSLASLGVGGLGCKSASQYISPQVEGRVLDATSHQPVERVRIARVNASQRVDVDEPAKGGQLMTPSDGVFTASDGTFKLESLKDVALFSHIGWYSVTLSFQHSGYQSIQATYTLAQATNNASGVPVVHAGDVLLNPNNR